MSLCKSICELDEGNAFCIGCGRTTGEITEWFYADKARKKEIAVLARERTKNRRFQTPETPEELF